MTLLVVRSSNYLPTYPQSCLSHHLHFSIKITTSQYSMRRNGEITERFTINGSSGPRTRIIDRRILFFLYSPPLTGPWHIKWYGGPRNSSIGGTLCPSFSLADEIVKIVGNVYSNSVPLVTAPSLHSQRKTHTHIQEAKKRSVKLVGSTDSWKLLSALFHVFQASRL
jgi:hypothetical protein